MKHRSNMNQKLKVRYSGYVYRTAKDETLNKQQLQIYNYMQHKTETEKNSDRKRRTDIL